MTQEVTIVRVAEDGMCDVAVRRESACGKNCAQCGGCAAPDITVTVRAENRAGGETGDRVILETESRSLLGAAAAVYLLPVVLGVALLVAGAQTSVLLGAILGACGLASGLAVAAGLGKTLRGRMAFVVTRIIETAGG
ncbi:SoxR reducing system RseC family protein [Oscillospiraceae bacterium OttesenSCG-928-F05]|nr:SoxR reducing system RseC family protein [Oscillospiraceae bacterium OttesenSCG-928-F05]